MRQSILKQLEEVLTAGALIETYLAGVAEAELDRNAMLSDAVQRRLEIIGEALRRLHDEDAPMAARVPHLPQIVAFRTDLAAGAKGVDNRSLWRIAKQRLPAVLRVISSLQEEERGR